MTSLPYVARKGVAIQSLFACMPRPRCSTGQMRVNQIRISPARVSRPKNDIWSSPRAVDDQLGAEAGDDEKLRSSSDHNVRVGKYTHAQILSFLVASLVLWNTACVGCAV
jgi:hypothetical protein